MLIMIIRERDRTYISIMIEDLVLATNGETQF